MKPSNYIVLVVGLLALQACKKQDITLAKTYDNSTSFVRWTIKPVTTNTDGETATPPPFFNSWCYSNQYSAPRNAATANVDPFYGYPIGTCTQTGAFSFNYSSKNTEVQSMSIFIESEKAITGTGIYDMAACFANNYVARVGMDGKYKNLYLANVTQQFTIQSFEGGYTLGDKKNITVVSGKFIIWVTDSPDSSNDMYTICGTFQLPLCN